MKVRVQCIVVAAADYTVVRTVRGTSRPPGEHLVNWTLSSTTPLATVTPCTSSTRTPSTSFVSYPFGSTSENPPRDFRAIRHYRSRPSLSISVFQQSLFRNRTVSELNPK